jgi:hypothetical protein
VAITSDVKARKVLHLYKRLGMEEAQRQLCRVLGQRARGLGRLETALQWFLQAKDAGLVAGCVQKMWR